MYSETPDATLIRVSSVPFQHTIVITHCNGSAGYIAPRRLFLEGGYESADIPVRFRRLGPVDQANRGHAPPAADPRGKSMKNHAP